MNKEPYGSIPLNRTLMLLLAKPWNPTASEHKPYSQEAGACRAVRPAVGRIAAILELLAPT